MPVVRPEDSRRPFFDAPIRRTLAEIYCLALVFWFYPANSNGRKAVTILAVLVWAILELGVAFGYATPPDSFFYFRLGVGVLVGRMWGIQLNNFAGVEFTHTETRKEGDDGD